MIDPAPLAAAARVHLVDPIAARIDAAGARVEHTARRAAGYAAAAAVLAAAAILALGILIGRTTT